MLRSVGRKLLDRATGEPAPAAEPSAPEPKPPVAKPAAKPTASTVDHATAMAFFERRRPTYQKLAAAVAPYVDKDATLFDVGANIGFFSLVLAEELGFEGTTHLFEPVPHLAGLCRETLKDARFEWKLHEFGLSDEDASLDIFIAADGNLGWNTMVAEKASKGMTRVPIAVRAFETAGIEDQPSFVKIDVEGAEYRVIRGMRRSLETWTTRPVILCEIGWGQSHPSWDEELEVLRSLEALGYETRDLAGNAIDLAEIKKTTDVLFVPKD